MSCAVALQPITYFPQAITSGDTVLLRLSFGNAPATGFTASLKINQVGAAPQSVAGSANGTAFDFVITNTITDALSAGPATWAVRATETATGYVITAGAGDFTVLADYADTLTKSLAQQQLDAANATLLILAGNPEGTASFNGHSYSKENMGALLDVIQKLKAIVAQETAAAAGLRGDPPTRSIRPYFT